MVCDWPAQCGVQLQMKRDTTMPETLPLWPDAPNYANLTVAQWLSNTLELEYEHARANAAMARLRVAVAELLRHTGHHECDDCWYSCSTLTCDDRRKSDVCDCGAKRVQDLVAAIGPLPQEGK